MGMSVKAFSWLMVHDVEEPSPLCVHEYSCPVMSKRHWFHSFQTSGFVKISALLFHNGLWALGKEYDTDVLFLTGHSTEMYPLHFEPLLVWSIHSTKKCLWCSWRAVLRYWYRDMSSEGYLVLCPFSRTTVTYPTIGFWSDLYCQKCICYYGMSLKSNQNMLGYPIISMPLLYIWAYFAIVIIIVVHRNHGWIRLLIPSPISTMKASQ